MIHHTRAVHSRTPVGDLTSDHRGSAGLCRLACCLVPTFGPMLPLTRRRPVHHRLATAKLFCATPPASVGTHDDSQRACALVDITSLESMSLLDDVDVDPSCDILHGQLSAVRE